MSKHWTVEAIPSLTGKIAVVTGANSGLGLETSAGLASAGAKVIMACRNQHKAATAMAEVKQRHPQADVEVMALDLASLESIRAFAKQLVNAHPGIDILCNNAGVMAVPLARTAEGFEMQIGTNHLGHFALTGLLLPALRQKGRIINVASLAHRWTKAIDLDDLNWEHKRYDKWDAYGKSKLANLLFTFELSRRLKKADSSIIAAAAHPGYSDTHLQYVGPEQQQSRLGMLAMKLGNALFAQPASMGALPTLYAATMPDINSADYIGPGGFKEIRGYPKKVGCRRAARDEKTATDLWALSEKLTGVAYLD